MDTLSEEVFRQLSSGKLPDLHSLLNRQQQAAQGALPAPHRAQPVKAACTAARDPAAAVAAATAERCMQLFLKRQLSLLGQVGHGQTRSPPLRCRAGQSTRACSNQESQRELQPLKPLADGNFQADLLMQRNVLRPVAHRKEEPTKLASGSDLEAALRHGISHLRFDETSTTQGDGTTHHNFTQ